MNNINNEMIKIIGRKKVYSMSFLTGMPQKDQGMTQRDPPDYKTVQKNACLGVFHERNFTNNKIIHL